MIRIPRLARVLLFSSPALWGGVAPAYAQTISDGLDVSTEIGPVTLETTDLDGVATTSGTWEYHTALSHDGIDSVKSLLPNRSISKLTTSVTGPAVVSFWWKITANPNFDKLYFRSNNNIDFIGGTQDWQQRSFEVDPGTQTIQWMFERFSSTPVGGTGQAWLDQLSVTPIPNNPALQGAVENFVYPLYSTDWTSSPFDGALNSNVAKSGPVEPGETSSMVLQVEGPAAIVFDWGIASDPSDNSLFEFRVNNDLYGSINGNQTLTRRKFEVPPGTHNLKFIFDRDATSGDPFYAGLSEGYLDQLVITPFGKSADLADAVDLADDVYSNAWTRNTATTHDGSDAAFASTPTADAARRLYAKIPDGAGLLTFWTKTNVTPENALFRVLVDGTSAVERNDTGDWQKTEINLGAGTDRLLEAILFRDASTNTAVSSAYLDQILFQPGVNNFQPDLSIGPRNKTLKGAGIVNATGAAQLSQIRAKARRPVALYSIRMQNRSASDADEIKLRGSWNDRHFEVLFVVKEGGQRLNYTAALKAGLFTSVELDPGESESHELWVVRKQESTKRSHVARVSGTSTTSPNKVDTVKTKVLIAK